MLARSSILLLAHVASALLGPGPMQVCGRRAVMLGAGSALVSWQPSLALAAGGLKDKGITPEERAAILERARTSTLTTERAIDRAKEGTLFDGLPPDVNCDAVVKIMNSTHRAHCHAALPEPSRLHHRLVSHPLSVDKKAIEEESILIKQLRKEMKSARGEEKQRLKDKIEEVKTVEIRLDQAVTDLRYDEVIKACLEEALAAMSTAF